MHVFFVRQVFWVKFMVKNAFFSSRVRQLRESHQLSLAQLSDVLGKKRSAISDIESGRIGTTLEVLTDLADFFAVSVDWLLGRTETPYVVEILERQEQFVFDLFKNITLSSNSNLIYFKAVIFLNLSANYFEYCGSFELEQRANVIYALNFWKYAAKKLNEEGFDSQEIPLHEVLHQIESDSNEDSIAAHVTNFINYLAGKSSSKRAGTAFVQLCNQCLAILDEAKRQIPDMQFKITQAQMLEREKNKPSAD